MTDEVSADVQGARLDEAHTSLDLLLSDTSEEDTNVVTCLTLVELLLECFNASDCSSRGLSLNTDHVDFITDLAFTLLNGACNDGTSAWNVD